MLSSSPKSLHDNGSLQGRLHTLRWHTLLWQGTAKALALPAADRKAVHAHANAAQWHDEYDDEYDDSFDDLGAVNLDGRTEVEGAPPACPPTCRGLEAPAALQLTCAGTACISSWPWTPPVCKQAPQPRGRGCRRR